MLAKQFNVFNDLLKIAMPISLGRLLNILANFIAMMMVAQLGKQQLAAGSLALASYIVILTSSSAIFYAIGIRIRYQQQAAREHIGMIIKNGLWLAIILAIPVALLLMNMDKLLRLCGQDTQLVALTRDYFWFSAIAMLPLLLITVMVQFYLGIGKPSAAFWIEVMNLPLTVIAAYGFVLGHFGLPQLGLGGVGAANLVVQSIMLMVLGGVMVVKGHHRSYQLFNQFKIDWLLCGSLLRFGLPIGIQFGGELAAMAVATYLMGFFGIDALAALQISGQYALLVFMLSFGMAQALALRTSEEFAWGAHQALGNMMQASFLILAIYTIPVVIVFCSAALPLAEFYLHQSIISPDFAYLVKVFFAISGLFIVVDGLRNFLSAVLRGCQEAKQSTRINLTALWLIALPLSALLAFLGQGGAVALRLGFLTGFIVAVVWLARHLSKVLKQSPVILTAKGV